MLKKLVMLMAIAMLCAPVACGGSGPDIEDGEWKITVEFDMPGMPMKMPPNTYTQCIKKDQPVPKNEKPNQQCVVKDTETKGNTVTWTMECTNRGGKMTGKGVVTYDKDKMDGTMTMTMEDQNVNMISRYKGVRIGDCK